MMLGQTIDEFYHRREPKLGTPMLTVQHLTRLGFVHDISFELQTLGIYAIVRHIPGTLPFCACSFAPITELGSYAPEMKLLAMDNAKLETEGTMQLVSVWLTKHGDNLKGIILAGDGFSMTGTLEAVKKAGRSDLIIVAAGNSKTGMDSIMAGEALAITYQSAEGCVAIAVRAAARWFRGEVLDSVIYLPKHIITPRDVANFMPAQWLV